MLNLRQSLVTAAVVSTVFASAQAGPAQVMHGRGVAIDANARAEFKLRVGRNDQNQLRGDFTFTAKTRNPERTVTIRLREPARFQVTDKRGVMSGPARLVVRDGRQTREVNGTVVVTGIDLVERRNNAPQTEDVAEGRPTDRLIVRFEAQGSDLNYSFEGRVVRGDIHVGAPERPGASSRP